MQLLLNILLIFLITTFSTSGQGNKIIVLTAESAVHPALTDYIQTGIEKAKEDSAECLIVQLNTPGGLLSSTRNIVTEFLQSEMPIIVYVSPSGAQAASAGVFITLASHIAAMAPSTNIGAAHPVNLGQRERSIADLLHELIQQLLNAEICERRTEKYGRLLPRQIFVDVELRTRALDQFDFIAKSLGVVA